MYFVPSAAVDLFLLNQCSLREVVSVFFLFVLCNRIKGMNCTLEATAKTLGSGHNLNEKKKNGCWKKNNLWTELKSLESQKPQMITLFQDNIYKCCASGVGMKGIQAGRPSAGWSAPPPAWHPSARGKPP